MTHEMTRNPEMQRCIEACRQCHDICLQMVMTLSMHADNRQVEGELFRILMNCAEICQTAANFMLSGSPMHGVICAACAKICDACAESCEQLSGMEDCVRACRYCAESCEEMAKTYQPHVGHSIGSSTHQRT